MSSLLGLFGFLGIGREILEAESFLLFINLKFKYYLSQGFWGFGSNT